jgi:hypothetical protein
MTYPDSDRWQYGNDDPSSLCQVLIEKVEGIEKDQDKIKAALTRIILHLGIEKDECFEV